MKHACLLRTAVGSLSVAAFLATNGVANADEIGALVEAAKKEGELTIIAVPHDWCGYGAIVEDFKAKYPVLKLNELDPDAGSGDEIEAIKANKGNKGPQSPDVIDVGLSFGPSSKAEGLLQPYKVSTWDSIPADQKDPEGYWYGDYYGVLSFEVNADLVPNPPQDWADLKKPEYANMVALGGDPRTSNQSIMSVFAAGLSASGGNADTAAEEGLKFFAELNKLGNLVPTGGSAAALAQGTTPIALRWSYNGLAHRDEMAGNPEIDVTVPTSGRFGGVYVQAISKYAPHPNAAKLWMEHLYSDEGQLMWLKGYCNPIRYDDMVERGVVPADLAAKLPDSTGAVFPTPEQLKAATDLITTGWDTTVGVDVVAPPE